MKCLSFLMMGGELGCEAEVLVQLTRPRGESSRSVGVIGTGHSLLARAWGRGGMGGERTTVSNIIRLSVSSRSSCKNIYSKTIQNTIQEDL